MKSRVTSATTLFLILVFICVSLIGTANAQSAGRLIVLRIANFGWNIAVNLKIDGRTVANVVQGRRYDHVLPAGRHVLTVSAVAKLILLRADIDCAECPSWAYVRIHGVMGRLESCCSYPISPPSGTIVLA